MKFLAAIATALIAVVVTLSAHDDKKSDDSFVPMFNGKDLTGWVNVNCAPGTFYVKDNEIITTGKPTGYLRTTKQYENFIAEFEWMHIPPAPGAVGNSGFFVWADPIPAVGTGYTRGIEVQVLVNLTYKNKKGEITATSQGDLFSIHGATCVPDRPHPDGWARCLPSENHCKGEKEWNHYHVEANDGVIKLTVNGHLVSGLSKCNPRKGYLALESEGSECRFRNLKIKELPSTNPKPEEVANEAQGHKPLFFGELTGWKAEEGALKHWQAKDTVLHYDGKGEAKDNGLRTEQEFGDCEFILDYRLPKDLPKNDLSFALTFGRGQGGEESKLVIGPLSQPISEKVGVKPPGQWNRMTVTLEGKNLTMRVNRDAIVKKELADLSARRPLGLLPDVPIDFANIFVRPLEKK
jgi:hypothetical protein